METFSALLAICAGNSRVPGEIPTQRPATRSFDGFFDLHLIKRLGKHSRDWWFETLSPPLWRHRNANMQGYGVGVGVGWICVSVSIIGGNARMDVHEMFRIGWIWHKEQLVRFTGCSGLPSECKTPHIFYVCGGGVRGACLLTTFTKNLRIDFHEKCRIYRTWYRKQLVTHDDVIKWKYFPRYWSFVRGIHRPPVNSPHKGQWRGALMFSLIYV